MLKSFLSLSFFCCLAICGHAFADSPDLSQESGEQARFVFDSKGHLRLATHLELYIPHQTPAQLPDRLLELFPRELPPPAGLEPHTRVWQLGSLQVIRRTWSREGIPVEGLSLTVHADARGHVVVISAQGLGYGKTPVLEASLSRADAEARAYRFAASLPGISPVEVLASRGIVTERRGLRAVWRVEIEAEPPGLPLEIRLDANSGELLSILPRASTTHGGTAAGEAGALIYLGSPLDGELTDVVLPDLGESEYLSGAFADVWQWDPPWSYVQTAVPTSTGDLRYDYPPIEEYEDGRPTPETQTDSFAEVMMYYHVNKVHRLFNDLGYFNDDPLDGIDRPIHATVNYRGAGGYYNNAYFSYSSGSSPGEIVFGQGEASDFSYDASVIYHEYGHAVIHGSSDYLSYCTNDIYGTDCTQGGLNEGTADYFSATLRGDPLIGAYSIGAWLPEYVRDLRIPVRCPDDLYGEEHEDGEIWGGAMWDVRTAVAGSNTEVAHQTIDPVILATIITPIPTDASSSSAFSYAAEILLSDAEATFGLGSSTVAQIANALDIRGMRNCTRFVPLPPGVVKEGAFSTAQRPSPLSVSAAGLQYVIEAPDNALSLGFQVDGLFNATLYVKLDEPVEFEPDSAELVSADLVIEGMSFELDLSSSPPLEPGHDYYVAFTSTQTFSSALWGYYYSVEASMEYSPEATRTDEDTGGCGCFHEPTRRNPPGAYWVLAMLPFGVLVRHRRKSDSSSRRGIG